MAKTAPCKDCGDKRHYACHDTCELYLSYKEERENYKKSIKVDQMWGDVAHRKKTFSGFYRKHRAK